MDTTEEQIELDVPLPDGDDEPTVKLLKEVRDLRALIKDIHERIDSLMQGSLSVDRLWTIHDVASYFGCSADTARRSLRRHSAPRPILIPSSRGHCQAPKYNADEIRVYALRHQTKR